jgi:hypothetical protein
MIREYCLLFFVATTVSYQWNPTGVTVAGQGGQGTAANQLDLPFGLAIDSSDSLYIADNSNNRIQKYLTGASSGATVAGQAGGTSGSALDSLNACVDVIVDSSSTLYIADANNHRCVWLLDKWCSYWDVNCRNYR